MGVAGLWPQLIEANEGCTAVGSLSSLSAARVVGVDASIFLHAYAQQNWEEVAGGDYKAVVDAFVNMSSELTVSLRHWGLRVPSCILPDALSPYIAALRGCGAQQHLSPHVLPPPWRFAGGWCRAAAWLCGVP